MQHISPKLRVAIGILIAALVPAALVYAALNTLNGVLSVSRGGTGNNTFATGTIPFSDGTKLIGDSRLVFSGGALQVPGISTTGASIEICCGNELGLFNGAGGVSLTPTNFDGQLSISGNGHRAVLDVDGISDFKTFFFPNQDGTFGLLQGAATSTIKIGDIKSCIVMADSDGSGATYVTANDGVLTATTIQPTNCQ